MEEIIYCEKFGENMRYDRLEWVRFMMSYDEELAEIYVCEKCEREETVRKCNCH